MKIETIIEDNIRYSKVDNVFSFILNDDKRPDWSKKLNDSFIYSNTDLKMKLRYAQNKK